MAGASRGSHKKKGDPLSKAARISLERKNNSKSTTSRVTRERPAVAILLSALSVIWCLMPLSTIATTTGSPRKKGAFGGARARDFFFWRAPKPMKPPRARTSHTQKPTQISIFLGDPTSDVLSTHLPRARRPSCRCDVSLVPDPHPTTPKKGASRFCAYHPPP